MRPVVGLVEKHGDGRLVLSLLIADFFAIVRQERLVLPPDLLLIFKAMVTIDGVLTGLQPNFDLAGSMRRSWPRLLQARFAPGHWAANPQTLLMELARVAEDVPRLIRALNRKLEAPPARPPNHTDIGKALRWAGHCIAAAIALAGAMVAASVFWGVSRRVAPRAGSLPYPRDMSSGGCTSGGSGET
jgi:ubiquinone biosynthesis protein